VNNKQEVFALIRYLRKFSGTANCLPALPLRQVGGENIFHIRYQLKIALLLEALNKNMGLCRLRMQALYSTTVSLSRPAHNGFEMIFITTRLTTNMLRRTARKGAARLKIRKLVLKMYRLSIV
jgi:hypothetical protein